MSQVPTDGKSLLDPFGIWKAARDTNLEAWSKLMIDIVNSDEYSKATGMALEQILATSQPLRDTMERSMTQTLSVLNMPSRAEVISIAERLVNVEMRLDDLDAKLNTIVGSLQETIKKTAHDAAAAQNTRLKGVETGFETAIKETVRGAMTTQNSQMKSIETQLQAMKTMLAELKVATRPNAQPRTESRVDVKPAAKVEDKPVQPIAKKEQEAK